MRRLSGPSVELQRRDSQSSRGWLKEANEQEGKKEHRSRNDWDNKSMKIQRKYDNYQWEVSVRQWWKDKQIEMKMVEENVIVMGEIIIIIYYHGPEKKKTTGTRKHCFIWLAEISTGKSRKEVWSTSEHLTAVIYELITALQLTSKLFYLFTHLSITGIFPTFGFIVSSHFYFCNRVSSCGAISGAGLKHNALKCSESPKTAQNKTTLLYLDSEIISCFSSISYLSHPFTCAPFSLIRTTSTLIRYLVPLLRRGLLIGWWCCLRCFLQVRDIGKVILLGHTNGQSQDHQLPFTGSP